MAQANPMGPPLSPRETRRSGRRSVPSASTSTSKSPDSDTAPRSKETSQRPSLVSNNSSSRGKRLKQEDIDDAVEDRKPIQVASNGSTSSTQSTTNGRTKRKAKEKDKDTAPSNPSLEGPSGSTEDLPPAEEEEEEQGITRCVCGSTGEDDPDAGEFMVQCETCKVWQHGLCMGYKSEDQLQNDDYYCEECKPELHIELLKKLRRLRHSSATSHHTAAAAPSRLSRSRSPSHLLKQQISKRRNTMNSRDAAFDQILKETLETTAAEAGAHDSPSVSSNMNTNGHLDHDEDMEAEPPLSRKKRKRADDDVSVSLSVVAKKRTRSASTASERPVDFLQDEATMPSGSKVPIIAAPPPPKTSGRNKRGGRKAVVQDPLPQVDGVDAPLPPPKRQGNNGRSKAANAAKRPSNSHAAHGTDVGSRDHGTRRGQTNGVNGQGAGSSTAENSRNYRNTHAYAISQQSLLTSWNLPDYLAHLEQMLPSETPQPLEVRAGRGDSMEPPTQERGVKVKWPSKRMSVGDMNKRVRALVEWVGREQAIALDRGRRKEALEKVLKDEALISVAPENNHDASAMILDGELPCDTPQREISLSSDAATMKMMEELMEELIGFQERFGPGMKRERDRRTAAASS